MTVLVKVYKEELTRLDNRYNNIMPKTIGIIATNTMHLVFDSVQSAIDVPMISLLDVVAEAILEKGIKTVGLLGTKYTMETEIARLISDELNSFFYLTQN